MIFKFIVECYNKIADFQINLIASNMDDDDIEANIHNDILIPKQHSIVRNNDNETNDHNTNNNKKKMLNYNTNKVSYVDLSKFNQYKHNKIPEYIKCFNCNNNISHIFMYNDNTFCSSKCRTTQVTIDNKYISNNNINNNNHINNIIEIVKPHQHTSINPYNQNPYFVDSYNKDYLPPLIEIV